MDDLYKRVGRVVFESACAEARVMATGPDQAARCAAHSSPGHRCAAHRTGNEELVAELLSGIKFLPIKVRFFRSGAYVKVIYTGMCSMFDVFEDHGTPPTYLIEVIGDDYKVKRK